MTSSALRSFFLLFVSQVLTLFRKTHYSDDHAPGTSPEQRQAQLFQQQLSPHELAYQESLIQEREQEIQEIETGIHELAEIFHDLGTLVTTQGDMIGMLPSGVQ
jgi:hypothetical protein